jgi:hypothetical protein
MKQGLESMKMLRGLSAVALVWMGLSGQVLAANLFNAAPATPEETARLADPRAARQTLLSLDAAVLDDAIHNVADDEAADRATRALRRGGEVDLPLFAGKSVHLRRQGVEAGPDGGVIWSGTVDGGGGAILVVAQGTVAGFVESGGHHYLIDPAGGHRHVLRELKASAFPKDRHIARPDKPVAPKTPVAPAAPEATSVVYVDLLVAYTAAAKASMTSSGATVPQMVDRDIAIMNRGLAASSLPFRMRRVGMAGVSSTYNENTASPTQPLSDLTSSNVANFAAIRSKRNTVHADMVALYIRQNPINYCGVAWVNVPPSASWAFGVVDAYCVGTVTLAHELGHAMGLNHDRYVEAPASAAYYNYGFVSTAGNFRDIMSYSDKCQAVLHRDCPVLTYYSKPEKTINGVRAGIPKGTSGAADASRWLREKAAIIAAFR